MSPKKQSVMIFPRIFPYDRLSEVEVNAATEHRESLTNKEIPSIIALRSVSAEKLNDDSGRDARSTRSVKKAYN
jgi:hypothetical protein